VLALAKYNLRKKNTTTLIAATLALPTYAWPFLATTDDYMCLIHDATPTNSTFVHKAYTVQMHIPNTNNTTYPIGFRHVLTPWGPWMTTHVFTWLWKRFASY